MKNRRDFLITASAASIAGSNILPNEVRAQNAPPAPSLERTTFVLSPHSDPYELFNQWLAEAKTAKEANPTAMTLATVVPSGLPDARMMLHKEIRDGRFMFVTHINTPKGEQLKANPNAALLFFWKTLNRQVRIRGQVEQLSDAAADAAWVNRGSRFMKLNDWAWPQSEVFDKPEDLEQRKRDMDAHFKGDVPRPAVWSGYLLTPLSIEFFYSQPTILHERLRFIRSAANAAWTAQRLVP